MFVFSVCVCVCVRVCVLHVCQELVFYVLLCLILLGFLMFFPSILCNNRQHYSQTLCMSEN